MVKPVDHGNNVHQPEGEGSNLPKNVKNLINKTDVVGIEGFNKSGKNQVSIGAAKNEKIEVSFQNSATRTLPSAKTITKTTQATAAPLGRVLTQKNPKIVNTKNVAYRIFNHSIKGNRCVGAYGPRNKTQPSPSFSHVANLEKPRGGAAYDPGLRSIGLSAEESKNLNRKTISQADKHEQKKKPR